MSPFAVQPIKLGGVTQTAALKKENKIKSSRKHNDIMVTINKVEYRQKGSIKCKYTIIAG